jgi:hypothetical protein
MDMKLAMAADGFTIALQVSCSGGVSSASPAHYGIISGGGDQLT